jgi:hypothetical protein
MLWRETVRLPPAATNGEQPSDRRMRKERRGVKGNSPVMDSGGAGCVTQRGFPIAAIGAR